jgi:uncharacterized protein involved in type VI secretion and phage assembly
MTDPLDPRPSPPGRMFGVYLAEVVSVKDDDRQGKVQVRLLGFDGVGEQDAPIWARVAVPFAGGDMGAFFIPNRGDEVVVQFVGGDPRQAIVTGGLWNGAAGPKEQLGGSGEEVDRWTLVGKQGTRIAIVEEQAGAKISLATPNESESLVIVQQSGGKIELQAAGAKITIDTQGVTVQAPSKVKVQAAQVEVIAATVKVNAAFTEFTGLVKAPIVQATTVLGTVYQSGAGNVW